MYNVHKKDHVDMEANTWALVCCIPIFNPLTSTESDPILADNIFGIMGGQFTFLDFKVYLDLSDVLAGCHYVCLQIPRPHSPDIEGSFPIWQVY